MPNGLARAKSPYLRQHEFNPVQWLPWGEEALERAQRESKPILLSIGYAACHWCHVMARESFEDPDTAALMNRHFVNIKVDREERPDVDAVYLRALQAMGKRAGWPLTMFLTPTGKPFWGGTYFPRVPRGQQLAFRDVLVQISDAYYSAPGAAEAKAAEVIAALIETTQASGKRTELSPEQIIAAAKELLRNIDRENGGLQGTPKFPYSALLRFLWNMGCRTRNEEMKAAVVLTLNRMIDGGIFDHLGGGFARYSIDARWLVPHFEKMLYDNALLVHLLTDVWRAKPVDAFRDIVDRTVGWLLREMTLPTGAFACSLDAESGDEEGGFYLWDDKEIDRLLGPDSLLFKRVYGITREGNFEHRNVLNRLSAPADLTVTEEVQLARCRAVLFRARSERRAPRRDDKVLADWNGLMIAALSKAAIVFDRPEWLEASKAAFKFVTGHMLDRGNLFHSWCDGELNSASILDDYANMALAAVALYEATGGLDFLDRAKAWVDHCAGHFRDLQHGAFYYTGDSTQALVTRICDGHDSATPSGNGIMAQVLARLYYLTGDDHYREQAETTVLAFAANVDRDSYQLSTLLDASQFLTSAVQIVIIGERANPVTKALLHAAHRHAGVDHVIMLVDPRIKLGSTHPAAGKTAHNGNPAAYVCSGTTCSAPVFDAQTLNQALDVLIAEY